MIASIEILDLYNVVEFLGPGQLLNALTVVDTLLIFGIRFFVCI